jgi:hypothetical protein
MFHFSIRFLLIINPECNEQNLNEEGRGRGSPGDRYSLAVLI